MHATSFTIYAIYISMHIKFGVSFSYCQNLYIHPLLAKSLFCIDINVSSFLHANNTEQEI